jgi:hypothetical protein
MREPSKIEIKTINFFGGRYTGEVGIWYNNIMQSSKEVPHGSGRIDYDDEVSFYVRVNIGFPLDGIKTRSGEIVYYGSLCLCDGKSKELGEELKGYKPIYYSALFEKYKIDPDVVSLCCP